MGKITATTFVTLDDRMVGPNEEMDWITENFDDEMGEDIDDVHETDAFLMGRVTYEIMSEYWPTANEADEGPHMIERMNETPKIVFSETLEAVEWSNARLAEGGLEAEAAGLRERDEDGLILGSASIVQAGTNLGVIDEYWLWLHPVVLGDGKPLFENIDERVDLELRESKTYDNGVVALHYGV